MKTIGLLILAGLCFGQSGPWITEKGMPDWWVKVHGEYLTGDVEPWRNDQPSIADLSRMIRVVTSEPGPTYVAAWQEETKTGDITGILEVPNGRAVFQTQALPRMSQLSNAPVCGKVNADGTMSPTSCAALPLGPTVSFSPQGAKVLETLTGKRIQGVGIDDVVICSPTGAPVQAGTVYQVAVNHGISPISPALAVATLRDTVSKNWRGYLIAGGGAASLAIPVLGQAGVISMSSRFVVALLGGHLFFDQLKSQLQARIPDPSPVLGMLLDPNSLITFTGTCKESAMITRFTNKTPVSGTFSLQ